jgi:imidazolonepropionase-like amidohydrolase
MRDAGVKIVAGSDIALFMSRPAALLRELQLLADAGLPAGDTIVAATRYNAEKIRKATSVGTIAPGQVADALLLNADPLGDIMHLVRPGHRVAMIRHGHLTEAVE